MQSNKNKSKYQNFLTLKALFELLNLIEYNSMTCKTPCFNTLYAYFFLCFWRAFTISFSNILVHFLSVEMLILMLFVSFSNLLC